MNETVVMDGDANIVACWQRSGCRVNSGGNDASVVVLAIFLVAAILPRALRKRC